MSTEAIKLIQHCLDTKDPYLDLGNCGLTDANVAAGTEFDELLRQCTHLQTLVLSSKWFEYYKDRKYVEKFSSNAGTKNKFATHPPALESLVELTALICAGEAFEVWSISNLQFLASLPNLQQLNLGYNQIAKIEGLDNLKSLYSLNLSANQIAKIEGLDKLNNLNSLDLSGNQIAKIERLDKLNSLNSLVLPVNQIAKIEGLDKLNSLNSLDLGSNKISKIEGLDKLNSLNSLYLYGNQIAKIEGLDSLESLNSLILYRNQIAKIEGLDKLSSLKSLELFSNQITKIEGLDNLNSLNSLYLSSNQIARIKDLDKLNSLNSLFLSRNQITKIQGLHKLYSLNSLDLSSNKIAKIEGLDKLKALNSLNLNSNQITKIEGLELFSERQDFHLSIFQNPLEKKYQLKLVKYENHFPFIKEILFRQDENDQVSFKYPIKVLVLGNHKSGKSSLVDSIVGLDKKGSTHILRIENYFINNPKGEQKIPDAIFYDFGGQDFYHGLYRAFMSNEGFQLILFNTKTDRNYTDKDTEGYDIVNFNRHYWLGQKKYTTNTDPYIMVQTYLEEAGSVDAPSIDYQRYQGYKKGFFLSLKNDLSGAHEDDHAFYKSGKDHFTTYFIGSIKKIIAQQQYKVSQWYIDFLSYIINKTDTNHCPTSIEEVLKKYNTEQKSKAEKLELLRSSLTTLHRHGLIIYYNTPGLQDVVWLNPQELVKHIQNEVLKKKLLRIGKGILKKFDFENKVVKDAKLLLLLKEQKVVFLHKPTGAEKDEEYIIPNYLPLANENDPGYQLFVFGLQQPDFIIKFNDFIPFGFINQLICFYGMQPDVKKFWRNQLLFTLKKEARILIQIDYETLQIKVYIQLLPTANSTKTKLSTYIFYSLLALYWDKVGNENILKYEEFISTVMLIIKESEINEKILKVGRKANAELGIEKKYEIWDSLRKDQSNVPPDAYLSVDGVKFISYQDLFELKNSYVIKAYLLKEGRIDFESGKEIPVSPFAPFTHKKLARMKNVFISYSHDDIAMRQTMQQWLINLVRDGLIEIWQDGLIQAGDDWDKKIKAGLETADICILLMSQSFIASNYVHEVEFKTIMEKHKAQTSRIIPVLIKDCDWKNWRIYPPDVLDAITKEEPQYKISSFQFLPQDENHRLKPLNKWPHPEEGWLQVAEEIRAFCEGK